MQSLRAGASAAEGAVHGILLAFPIALFTTALITDIAYLRTAQVQWTNFSSWLIAGALVGGGAVLAWSLIRLLFAWRTPARRVRMVYAAVVAVMWVLGLINAFKHSQDAWTSVGAFGVTLSLICTLLALAAGVIAFSGRLDREVIR
ncbi:DUF2231 domain-containing protein [Brevundimonas sp.]|uniref:DUF2231 domain-containing protein n=1 Tax=Brevundimonas sp. TaxID=1871086 RepID=UPI002D4AA43D|nr:DUF2231 domain-containing protein [Brevundimonas sp.]HYC69167.1 DUF2231 domain-containing protein [Brevundimonas sp.]